MRILSAQSHGYAFIGLCHTAAEKGLAARRGERGAEAYYTYAARVAADFAMLAAVFCEKPPLTRSVAAPFREKSRCRYQLFAGMGFINAAQAESKPQHSG